SRCRQRRGARPRALRQLDAAEGCDVGKLIDGAKGQYPERELSPCVASDFSPAPSPLLLGLFMKITPATRIERLPPYVLGRLKQMILERRQAGADVIDLNMGNPSDP